MYRVYLIELDRWSLLLPLHHQHWYGKRKMGCMAKEKRSVNMGWWRSRTCKVSCLDANGAEHAVEVTARSLFEAVARGLHVLRQNDWVDTIHQNSTITIAVKEPQVEHKVRIRDFENWLASNGKSPAEQALKSDLRELLKTEIGQKREYLRMSAAGRCHVVSDFVQGRKTNFAPLRCFKLVRMALQIFA